MEPVTQLSSSIPEWIGVTKDILVGLSAVVATIFAYLGLYAWRKELKGKSEYQLAKDILKSVYKVREAFKHVRNIVIFQYEYPEDMQGPHGHLKPEYDHEGTAHVYETRWKLMDESFKELEEYHILAQVEWGPEFQDRIKKLRACRSELLVTIQQMLRRKKNPNGKMNSIEEQAEEESVLYHIGEDSKHDKFTPKINEAIQEFEDWLRPHIKKS